MTARELPALHGSGITLPSARRRRWPFDIIRAHDGRALTVIISGGEGTRGAAQL
jgi:hypothetical protein